MTKFLQCCFCLLSVLLLLNIYNNVYAQQTAKGDVIGPNGVGGTGVGATAGGGRVPRISGLPNIVSTNIDISVPTAADITGIIDSGVFIGGLSGCADAVSAVADIDNLFDDIPPELQVSFMDALFSSNSDACIIGDLVDLFEDLDSWLDGLNDILCAGLDELNEGLAAAQNAIISQLSPENLGIPTSLDTGSLGLPADFVSDLGIDVDLDLSVDLGLGLSVENLIGDLDFQGLVPGLNLGACDSLNGDALNDDALNGPVNIQESDCSSNWQGLRDGLRDGNSPATMNNPELRFHARRAAIELGMDPNQLMGVMWAESRGDPTLSHTAGCPNSATGLIQFLRATAAELGEPHRNCQDHRAIFSQKPLEEQMDLVIRYYQQRGWEAGMTDYQAYATVHHGNPHGSSTDGANSGVTTESYFNSTVLARMEAFRCGGFDWNTLEWVDGA